MGKLNLFVMAEDGMMIQLVPNPFATVFVCISKNHPVWSCGQESVNRPPLLLFEQSKLTGATDIPGGLTTNCISPGVFVSNR